MIGNITLHKPILLAKGRKPPVCPQCELEDLHKIRGVGAKNYQCYNCGLKALEAMVFRIKETQDGTSKEAQEGQQETQG